METRPFFETILGDIFNLQESVTIIVLSLVLVLSVYYIVFVRKKRNLPPGPIGLPLLGYWPFLGKHPYKTLNRLAKKYGNVFGLYFGRSYAVVFNDWSVVKDVLSKAESLSRPPGLFDKIPYGLGISGANGQVWSEQRRFSVKTMKDIGLGRPQWAELVQDEVDEIVKIIQSEAGQPVDVTEVFGSAFTNNILTMLFGHRLPYDDPAVKRLSENINIFMHQSPSLGLSNFLPSLCAVLLRMGVMGSTEAVNRVKEFPAYIRNCVEQNLKNEEIVEQESFVKTYFQEVQQNKKKNLNNSFTDSSLVANTQTLVLAGSETMLNAFTWLLVSMAKYPDRQRKVHRELDKVLGKNSRIKWSDRTKVPYTLATIMESMRWKSLVPINTLRMCSEDTTIQGYDIPKGTMIVINQWALHNDPRYWKDPENFEPERFLQDGGKSVNLKPDSYFPFSFGKRMCPGEMVALIEILQFFVTLMQKFKILSQDGDTKVKINAHLGLTYQPLGVKLKFLPRE